MIDIKKLQPGDCLLFARKSLVNRLISIKTFSPYTHVEIYAGDGYTYASRNGIGVRCFHMDLSGLALVLRPKATLDWRAAIVYFRCVDGQGYDWLGLFAFFAAGWHLQDHRQFCSEFATNFYRAAGLDPFSPETNADHVPPSYFAASPAFSIVP